ncbi:deoxynucleoside kinase-like [Contarinia nasturtii]|uniref:deoxynucleoside kinase-like n=1 Tax=Contarinia nasturtii TaxID=265458 RepID=UPI0012D389B3|nr:deoxynucleoside kinase-like [Contarinia nasturtii]
MSLEKKPHTILVEGNTFLEYLKRFKNVEVMPEPIDSFRNLNGSNLLDLVYKDIKKWAFPFQTYIHLLELQNHLKTTGKSIKVMERSLFGAQHIFVEALLQNNKLEKEEYDILQKWFDFTITRFDIKPNLIVYLRATPNEVFGRMKKRGRPEENNVDIAYIEQIHELYEKWLMKECGDVPVLVLNANLSAYDVQQEYEKRTSAPKMIL